MKALKYLKSVSLVILSAGILTTSAVCLEKVSAQPAATTAKPAAVQQPAAQTVAATPLSIVDSPKTYLNKTVIMKAKFDKFSTLGLDYKPAFKSSDDYISFLIKRDDTTHDIPLSEMKLFLKRDLAEKFIDLKNIAKSLHRYNKLNENNYVQDAQEEKENDVSELKIIKKAPETKKN